MAGRPRRSSAPWLRRVWAGLVLVLAVLASVHSAAAPGR